MALIYLYHDVLKSRILIPIMILLHGYWLVCMCVFIQVTVRFECDCGTSIPWTFRQNSCLIDCITTIKSLQLLLQHSLSVSVSLYMCNLYLFCTKMNIQVVWIFCTSAVIHMEEKRREEKKRERQEYLYLSVIHRVVEEKWHCAPHGNRKIKLRHFPCQ